MFKFISRHWQRRYERFYRRNRWHLALDLFLGIIIILLVAAVIALHLYNPKTDVSPISSTPAKGKLDLNNLPLSLGFSVTKTSFRLADGAELKIACRNSGQFPIDAIKIGIATVGNDFNIEKIEALPGDAAASAAEIKGREIILDGLSAGESQEMVFKVHFADKTGAKRDVSWQAAIEYSIQDQAISQVAELPSLNLAAELSARASAYYNSPQGDQLGSGPLPPIVGLPTNYWIFLEVKSKGDFQNLVFSAKLPAGVELTGGRSILAGDFQYNSASRQIIWKISGLKDGGDSYRAGFEVQLIPSAGQSGKIASLLNNIKYYAYDAAIGENDYGTLADLNTDLDSDLINKGQGKVMLP